MEAPGIANSEENRLSTLRRMLIMDNCSEERFDRVTRIASKMFHTPIALVSLVDEKRQWFKSCIGLKEKETPRDISFCGHTILGDDTFYIPDVTQDSRFADNPLVVGPTHVRFYAGQPLSAPNGEKLGTLCLMDTKPRIFNDEDILALQSLAKMVEVELAAIYMATVDDLTHISNRRGFEILAEQSLKFSIRNDCPMACVYFDLDKFKQINDEYGHEEGDKALVLFAEQLKGTLRESDIVARIGGDEFVALMSYCNKFLTEEIIMRLQKNLCTTCGKMSLPYDLLFSAGIIEFNPKKHADIGALMNDADHSMYDDKKNHHS